MANADHTTEILIVGAGIAGLTAANALRKAGHDVLLIDKGRGVGGRLASRRIGQATFDHGAQFITARTPRFIDTLNEWVAAGVAKEWFRGADDGHPRWCGTPGMTAIAKYLVRDQTVLLGKRVAAVRRDGSGWMADVESGETLTAAAVLLTAPVPQSLALLDAGQVVLDASTRTSLDSLAYDRCIAVMAVLDGPSHIPPPGGFAPTSGPIAWITDNQLKGVSSVPAVTVHATAAFSLDHWDEDRQASAKSLLDAAESWIGTGIREFQVHGWLYSKPVATEGPTFATLETEPPLVIAGDAFGGPRVEGGATSGWDAADALTSLLRRS